MATKILVTGGAGFIGSHLVDRLIQEGHQVSVLDDLSTGKRKNINKQAQFYKMDIQSRTIEKAFKKERPIVLIHLAAQMNVRMSTEDPIFDASVNIVGTLNVLDHAVRHGVRRVVFASSGGAVYGESDGLPVPESHPTDPFVSIWNQQIGRGKVFSLLCILCRGLRHVSLRFGNVYGPRQEPEGEAGVIAIFSKLMLNGGQPIINGTGMQTRDFIYVDDVVESIMVAMKPDIQGVYNVGTGQETSVNDCYKILKDLTGSECKEIHGPAKKGEQQRSVLNVEKIREELEWDPQVSFSEGLTKTVEYFKAHQA